MRTTIELNEELIREAMELSKARSKSEVVDLALQSLVAQLKRRSIKSLFGRVEWEGDLKKMREV